MINMNNVVIEKFKRTFIAEELSSVKLNSLKDLNCDGFKKAVSDIGIEIKVIIDGRC